LRRCLRRWASRPRCGRSWLWQQQGTWTSISWTSQQLF
jgi:hypothetical protein